MMLFTTLVVSFLVFCLLEVCCGLARVVSGLQAIAHKHTATQERNEQCDNQHHSHEFLMIGKVVPETC